MQFIADKHGRFLTVMPRTRAEDKWFRDNIKNHAMDWQEVHREENPRGQDLPDIVYRAAESAKGSAAGDRLLWYCSSQKEKTDRQARQRRLPKAQARLPRIQGP